MKIKYNLTLITSVIETLCFSGIMFGWGSFSYVLRLKGYFNSSCNETELQFSCSNQEIKLELVFTLASVLCSVSSLGSGYILDKFGTLVLRLFAFGFILFAFLINALIGYEDADVLYITAIMTAVGGYAILMTNIPVCNLFQNYRAVVISVMNGAYDSSALIFVFVKVAYEYGISYHAILYFIIATCFFILLKSIFLMPKIYIPYNIPSDFDYGLHEMNPCSKRQSEDSVNTRLINHQDDTDNDTTNVSQTLPLKSFAWSVKYILNIFFLGLLQLRNQFFYGSVDPWLRSFFHITEHSTLSHYLNVFGIVQLGGILVSPVCGTLIDFLRQKFQGETSQKINQKAVSVSMAVTSLLGSLFSLLVLIPILPLQYLSFILQVAFRSFLYGSFSSFIVTCYPSEQFGRLYGISQLCAACIASLQFPLFYVVEKYFDGSYVVINIILLCTSLLTIIHPIYLYVEASKKKDN